MPEDAYQSLYRRYRPQRFAEVRGQDHVATALRNAVRRDRVSHAYLFSGPRGTGKTSTARILAKVLNCESPVDGEPCGECESCKAVAAGSSLDVHELDAASNNGVEAMRELVARSALATPGRHKVYIVDEVHMLSTAASNTLLKTLEGPPPRVVFVLATTDPHKVLPTIVSRTQHFEFHLLQADVLAGLLNDVQADAGLDLPPAALSLALKRGNGSARDALSALDQLVAAEGVSDEVVSIEDVMEALCERDAAAALLGVARGIDAGRDPQRLAGELVAQLRQGFLAKMAPKLVELAAEDRDRVADQADRLGTALLVRSMETLGLTLVEMRDALEPRLCLEIAVVRLARPESDGSQAALLERIERLEQRLDRAASTPGLARQAPPAGPAVAGARAALGALGQPGNVPREAVQVLGAPPPLPASGLWAPAPQAPRAHATGPSRDDLVEAWGDHLLESLGPRARSLFRAGRFLGSEAGTFSFALPDPNHRANCEPCREEVEGALSAHFGVAVRLRLVVDETPGQPGFMPRPEAPEAALTMEEMDLSEVHLLPEAEASAPSATERVLRAFPGAERVGTD